MVTLAGVLFLGLLFFTVTGLLRGYMKEFLVTSSVLVAILITVLLERYAPALQPLIQANDQRWFWVRAGILIFMVIFGYQTPRFIRPRNQSPIRDALLGALLGALNGYLIIGTLWYYLAVAGYPWPNLVRAPVDPLSIQIAQHLPPAFLGVPGIYIAVAIMFVFVIVMIV
ncbi:MAG: hypothetical protein GXO56_01485 [Chloroflexi bacterium]|nr:hypothetical protein [Chloroflexota bacterium]